MIELKYDGKKSEWEILSRKQPIKLKSVGGKLNLPCMLIKGSNEKVLRNLYSYYRKVDLVYIDPPWNTQTVFRVAGERTSSVSWTESDSIAYSDIYRDEDYLEFIRERLILLRELLSESGSIYVHIDCKVGHYVKILMDEIFGQENFRNNISRIKCNAKNFPQKSYGNNHDMVLFYSKGNNPIWNNPELPIDLDKLYRRVNKDGRRYTTRTIYAPGETKNGATGKEWKGMLPPKGRHWTADPKTLDEWDARGLIEWSKNGVPRKIMYADEKTGRKPQDVLDYRDPQRPIYPTEKNIDLMKLFIMASSNPDSIVLDPSAGSGVFLQAAAELGRKWIGIDQSDEAIKVIQKRLLEYEYEYLKLEDCENENI